ncbi:hypothetical protein FRB97_009172 [Tulasnella sp. 331]|nr:hypothetical protein FRB97_009172 [Tulasnella sp. 331]
MSHQQADVDRAPLGALSLLSLAASQVKPQPFTIPRSAPTTSVSHSPLLSTGTSPLVASTATTGTGTIHTFTSTNGVRSGRTAPTANNVGTGTRGSVTGSQPKARRLSSTSQSKRRVQDATAATIQATAASGFSRGASVVSSTGLSAAAGSLSLSTSPTIGSQAKSMQQVMGNIPASPDLADEMDEDEVKGALSHGGKRKGTIYRCESCSKVYRHPNCLLKHRWEHSPHWREASKFLLSKHQQVQLLEAAAILSHLSPQEGGGKGTGTSLPEDRSLWPSYLSGGLLPAPSTKTPSGVKSSNIAVTRVKNPPPNAAPPPAMKREGSSEEENLHPMSTSNSKDSGYSSGGGPSSLPAETAQAPFLNGRSVSDQTSRRTEATQKGSPAPAGLYFGSVDAIPTNPILSQNMSLGYGFNHSIAQSMQPQYLSNHSDVPPYARGGTSGIGKARSMRRHGRTSSSLSSSYTRSSIRGGGADDEDEDDDDDAMDEDNVGYLSPVSPVYGSATSGVGLSGFGGLALSPDPNYGGTAFGSSGISALHADKHATIGRRSGRGRGDDVDFDVLYERDEVDGDGDGEGTVDDDGSSPAEDREHTGGGAGMEIDMDL